MNWYEEIDNVFSIERIMQRDRAVCFKWNMFDSEGGYNYISSTGKSIIDYFITEPEIDDLFTQFHVSDMDIGQHLPVIGYIGEVNRS